MYWSLVCIDLTFLKLQKNQPEQMVNNILGTLKHTLPSMSWLIDSGIMQLKKDFVYYYILLQMLITLIKKQFHSRKSDPS